MKALLNPALEQEVSGSCQLIIAEDELKRDEAEERTYIQNRCINTDQG